jgi:hypothetical protein
MYSQSSTNLLTVGMSAALCDRTELKVMFGKQRGQLRLRGKTKILDLNITGFTENVTFENLG